MNDLYIYEKILKIIRERQNTIRESLCVGPVGDFVAFNTMPIKPFGEDWSGKDFIVIEVQRTLGKLSCKFREV